MGFRERCMPDLLVQSVYDIDLRQLKQRGINGFIFDIDNTLVTYDDAVAGEKLSMWLGQLSREGFSAVLVSNNSRKRVARFAASVALPFYARALKPCKHYLAKACRTLKIPPEHMALVGDQVFTDILGGNRMKMFTVLVNPISDKDTWFIRQKRRWEKCLIKPE